MYFIRMLALRKTLSLTLRKTTEYQYLTVGGIDFSRRYQLRQCHKDSHANVLSNEFMKKTSEGLITKLLRKCGFQKEKYQLMAAGYLTYEDILDKINYSAFFKDFNMPDTFYSWFKITELHVWMLMVRYMAEGENGKLVRNNLVEAMWIDVQMRVNKLGPMHARIKRKQVTDLSHQFNAALIDYDEGIMSDDKVLAGALWRAFFSSECNNPEHIEKLVAYVRKQVNMLDKIPAQEVLNRKKINWIDLRSIR